MRSAPESAASTGLDGSRPPVVDAQVQLGSQLAIPREFLEYQADNAHHRMTAYGHTMRRERMLDRVLSVHQDDDADRLVAEMDDAGVDQAFLVIPDYSHVARCALTPPELAGHIDKVSRRHAGRFKVFWGVDPRGGQDGIDLFERCVTEYGFAGLKLYPLCGYSPSDRRLYPYFEICASRGLPVLSHTGPGWGRLEFGYGAPLLLDAAARDFPRVNFILGHGGVTHVEEATYMCSHRPNVYLDISQFHSVLAADGWQAHLNCLFRLGISHKILFGTCWPSYRLSESLTGLVSAFAKGQPAVAGLKERERRMITGGNSLRLVARAPKSTTENVTDTDRGGRV